MSNFIDGLSIDAYIRDEWGPEPTLSASAAHVLLTRAPKHVWQAHPRLNPAWEPSESTTPQIIGTAVHAILLEDSRDRIVTIPYDDYRTKKAQEMRDSATAHGLLPILDHQLAHIDAAVEAARAQIATSEIPDALQGGHAERTLVWQQGGVWFRSRPDWMSEDGAVLVDLKTTGGSGEPAAWSRGPMMAHGSDLQCALALRGMTALFGPAARSFIFAVLELEPPYALALVGLDPQFMEFANDKLDAAARIWSECRRTGVWPAYPSRVCWASPPEYLVYKWGEKRATAPDDPLNDSVEAL